MIEVIGWLSAICLGFCGLPQAYKTWQTKRAKDISWLFLLLWLAGELLGAIYILSLDKLPLPIFMNYIANIIVIMVILRYKNK